MAKKLPTLVRNGGPERERKYRIITSYKNNLLGLEDRVALLRQVFDFVSRDTDHFHTLDQAAHTSQFDKRLVDLARRPVHAKPLRERFYWATKDLRGYKPTDIKGKAEIRTESKIGKDYHEQVLKLGIASGRTLERDELPIHLNSFGVNVSLYDSAIVQKVQKIIGKGNLKPMVRFQAQPEPVLYNPEKISDTCFEIKFDFGIMRTFDQKEFDVVEIEIEEKKRSKGMNNKQVEDLLNLSETRLFGAIIEGRPASDILEPLSESKPEPAFKHLVGLYLSNPPAFEKAAKSLSPHCWTELTL